MMFRFRFPRIAAGTVALAASLPVRASDPVAVPPDPQRAAPAQRIAIDPRTGAIGAAPTAPAPPSLRPAASSAPLAGVRLTSGAVRVDLKGRYRMAVVARRDGSGAITTTCEPAGTPPGRSGAVAAGPGEVSHEK